MDDVDAKEGDMAATESILYRTLGSASLTPEQRQRHQRLLADYRSPRDEGLFRGLMVRSLFRVGIVAVLLAAIAVVATNIWPLSPKHSSDVSAAVQRFNAPPVGRGRHITIQGELGLPTTGVATDWTTEIWQRTLSNTDTELSMEARSSAGSLLGQYIQSAGAWTTDIQGEIQQGQGEPRALPAEIENTYFSPQALQSELQSFLTNGSVKQLGTTRQGTLQVTTFDATNLVTAEYRREFLQDYGISIKQASTEISVDVATGQLHSWKQSVVDEQGKTHLIRQLTITHWDDTSAAAIDSSHFAIVPSATPQDESP